MAPTTNPTAGGLVPLPSPIGADTTVPAAGAATSTLIADVDGREVRWNWTGRGWELVPADGPLPAQYARITNVAAAGAPAGSSCSACGRSCGCPSTRLRFG